MDGIETTRQIRKQPELEKIPIIAMTGNVFLEDRTHCFDAGMNDVLLKPFDPDKLFQLISKWIESSSKLIFSKKNLNETKSILIEKQFYKGSNLEYIEQIFGQDLNRYFKLLVNFNEKYEKTPELCRQYVTADDYPSAKTLIHKFNGASGTLGLRQIQKYTSKLETLLNQNVKEKTLLLENLKQLFDEFKSFQQYISTIPKEIPKSKQRISFDKPKLQKISQILESYLVNNDTRSNAYFEEVKEVFNQFSIKHSEKLEYYLKEFDYPKAMTVLDIFKKMINSQDQDIPNE